MSARAPDVVIVGRIGAPHGVRGWLRINSFTQPPGNLLEYRPWLIESAHGWSTNHPAEVKPHKQGFVARFAEIGDRDAAGAWSGKHVAIERALLPQLAQDEYYWRDLEGLAVWNRGVELGVVDHLIETGANPVLVVRSDGKGLQRAVRKGAARQTLIPFVDEFVIAVDLGAARIDVSWDEAE
ncbi:MAG: ribosome maturation factor RimM [Gammaproteobacteria bacterium]|nr:ribosome maturation factor RimM [Gammaproteobacteria bacterium]